jgi:hypothetical protein
MTSDDRMTWGLIAEVFHVLERHGYHQHDNQHTSQAADVIGDLARTYEGTHDAGRSAHLDQAPPIAQPEPGSRSAEQRTVILTDGQVRTIMIALDEAADHKRDRAVNCADCTDRSCATCQWHLHVAQTYDQVSTQMLDATAFATVRQAAPDGEPGTRGQPQVAADREAGQ